MSNQILQKRISKELRDLEKEPRPGITCYPKEDNIFLWEAYIKGPPDSPYDQGLYKLSVQVPDRYPFEPPQIKFITRIYHPNIDDGGRICADILKTGEKGTWNPAINIATALLSIRQLIATPNPDDPLEVEIAQEYKFDYPTFEHKAKEFTKKYASEDDVLNTDDIDVATNKSEGSKTEKKEEEAIETYEKREGKPKSSLSLSKKRSSGSNSQSSLSSQKISAANSQSSSISQKLSAMNSQPLESQDTNDSLDTTEDIEKPTNALSKPRSLKLSSKAVKKREIVKSEENTQDNSSIIQAKCTEKNDMKAGLAEDTIKKKEEIIVPEKSEKAKKGNKSSAKEKVEQPVVEKVEKTKKNTKLNKRKAVEVDAEVSDKENSPNPNKRRSTSPLESNVKENEGTIKDSSLLKKEEFASIYSTAPETSTANPDFDDDITSLKVNDSDIASSAIDIINSAMLICNAAEEEHLLRNGFRQDIIELSDDDDENVNQRPIYHSLSLNKKTSTTKISLSRKKRS